MVITGKISLKSRGERDILDITPQVAQQVTKAEINSGVVTLFVAGSTAGLTTIEFEPGLISDFQYGSALPPKVSPITTTAAGATVMAIPTSRPHYWAPHWSSLFINKN